MPIIIGCGGKNSSADSDNATATTPDSISSTEAKPIAWLPDTVYESAKAVKYTIETVDTSVTGQLQSPDDLYHRAPGSLTFRHGAMRDADFGGRLPAAPTTFEIEWTFDTDEDYSASNYGSWGGGTGWTGQPLYIEWPDTCLQKFKAAGQQAAKHEIIVGSLSGRVYFIDYDSGKPSRDAINTRNPIKGTISLDPTLNGNLYVGQGVPAHEELSALVIDLNKHSVTNRFGPDPKAQRRWHAYDSSPVRVAQFLFRPGENGTLYKFTVTPGNIRLHSALRYTVGGSAPGMEASMSVYLNYGFTADNAGNILCINLSTLQPVWRYKLPDDTDATPVVAKEADGNVYIYTGCEVEHDGVTEATFVKLDALTGREIWKNHMPARRMNIGEKHFDGGYYATALPGRGNCSDLIFTNCVYNTDQANGSFVAFNRTTGQTAYTIPLHHYAWASPVGFTDPSDKFYIVTADCAGNVYLIDGIDGTVIHKASVGANFESSPVVAGNSIVVGSRGKTIYKLTIK